MEEDLYRDLRALAEASFPKRCTVCGRVYPSAEEFLRLTTQVREAQSGLKQTLDDDDRAVVELFRNCLCGSTLMDLFADRRDSTEEGQRKREQVGAMLDEWVRRGLSPREARAKLRKVLEEQRSASRVPSHKKP